MSSVSPASDPFVCENVPVCEDIFDVENAGAEPREDEARELGGHTAPDESRDDEARKPVV